LSDNQECKIEACFLIVSKNNNQGKAAFFHPEHLLVDIFNRFIQRFTGTLNAK